MEDDVLRFDVSMYDPERMDLIDGIAHLLHDEGYPCLRQRLRLLELMVKLPSCSDLQNNVDVDCVVEAAIHLDDIRMIEEHLDLNLSGELICYLLFMQQLLLYYFKSAYEVAILLLHQIHSAVFATSQLFYLDEVINTHFFLRLWQVFEWMKLGIIVI